MLVKPMLTLNILIISLLLLVKVKMLILYQYIIGQRTLDHKLLQLQIGLQSSKSYNLYLKKVKLSLTIGFLNSNSLKIAILFLEVQLMDID